MYSEREKAFISYWEKERVNKKSIIKRLYWGMPLAAILAIGIAVNAYSGWYKRADMMVNNNSSLIIILIIAVVLIVAFSIVFSARHNWDRNEQLYQELLHKGQS